MLNFSNNLTARTEAIAIFVSEKYEYKDRQNILSKYSKKLESFLKVLKDRKTKDKINSFDISEETKCFVIKIEDRSEAYYPVELGGEFFSYLEKHKNINKVDLYIDSAIEQNKNSLDFDLEFIFGFNLKSYVFDKYKTTKKTKNNNKIDLKIITSKQKQLEKEYKDYNSILKGVFLTRNLVSEPPNVLNPNSYVKEIKKLSKIGLKIEIYDEKKMKNLGMNSLLGVGRGSKNESYLVTIEWNGKKGSFKNPLAFVGKGVCFDTGGISLKPAKFMEEMKYDMAGSAVVVGLLKTLALRNSKINAVGVVGLVENMPGGNAQRPGDIVKSFSGKTIEVLNTDAEGRLVLADALSFTEKKYKPEFIIDLATLTGAIIVGLGEEYAGLFSNSDSLSKKIYETGVKVNEKVWRLPLHKNYDKLINSTVADVQNINYSGGAGSITAAQFLQRFILNKTTWAHLDIAGMAFSKKAANLNPGGATGFGVRLLNSLVKKYYE